MAEAGDGRRFEDWAKGASLHDRDAFAIDTYCPDCNRAASLVKSVFEAVRRKLVEDETERDRVIATDLHVLNISVRSHGHFLMKIRQARKQRGHIRSQP
jgi:hypothetical protein